MSLLVGKEAPDFSVRAVVDGKKAVDSYTLSQFKNKKYILLFFYPLDFTFVCPTELHSFQEKLTDFEFRDVQVLGCSVDSTFSHLAWLKTPKNIGGISGVSYPLLSDFKKEVSRAYDVLFEGLGASYRGLFLIDKSGIVRHQLVNDLPLGRSIEEALRMIDALQFFEKHGEVCPANWTREKPSMKASEDGLRSYFSKK